MRGLTKRFQGVVSVDGVSFSLSSGEILGLIGPNGAGKTTLVNMISGTLSADEGELDVRRTIDRRLTAVPSCSPRHRAHLSGDEAVPRPDGTGERGGGALFGFAGGERSMQTAREQAREWLSFVGLGARVDHTADSLSGPDRKRLELAKALALRPKLLLLDEVMAGLNTVEIDEVVDVIKQIRARGVTILIIEHIMKAVRSLADRVLVLHHGEQIAEGDTATVFDDPRVIEAYLGRRRT